MLFVMAAALLSLGAYLPAALADDGPRPRARSVLGIFDPPGGGPAPASKGNYPVRPLSEVPKRDVPPVDRRKVDREDEEAEARGGPMRFAIANKMNIDASAKEGGAWETLPDGTRVWRYRVETPPGCESLSFGFGEYWMPEGATLHIYDAGGKTAIGRPFTAEDNGLGELWTPILPSCDVVIEVDMPAWADLSKFKLVLTTTNVGYRGFHPGRGRGGDRGGGGRELSGSCNVDVVCTESDGAQYAPIDQWRDEIPSVAVYTTQGRGGSLVCTGAMINNAKEDRTPYFLTANHCGIRSGNEASVVTYWNYETSSCQGRPDGELTRFITGSVFKTRNSKSDVTLIQLSSNPLEEWGVTYAGWDRTDAAAASAVGIHHPSTDEKRISFEDDELISSTWSGTPDTHWEVRDWDVGTTEPGSSGSPLFNQDHRIVGQLHGGRAACGNNLEDLYGKFSYSWDNTDPKLANWLDPDDTGITQLDTLGSGTQAPTSSSAPSKSRVPTNYPTVTLGPTPECKVLKVDLRTDDYPEETSWTVINDCDGGPAIMSGGRYDAAGQLFTETKCVPPKRYTFKIKDAMRDGICCGYGRGSYAVTYDGDEVAAGGEFRGRESQTFGSCTSTSSPTPAPVGSVNCVDDGGWYFVNKNGRKRCGWVKKKPNKRCDKEGYAANGVDRVFARDACVNSCNDACKL